MKPRPAGPRCVLLACGGTGGHIFPAFSVAEELKSARPDLKIVYVCGKKDIENAIFRMISGETVVSIESAPFRGARSLFSPSFLIKLLRGIGRSAGLLRREKPEVVVGFGGHYSFPVIVAAKLLGIKTMIHEQNVMPGFANKVLSRWVDSVALSFGESRPYLAARGEVRETGNPIRAAIERECRDEAMRFFGFDASKITALVLGGSQGSESINTVLFDALKLISPEAKASLQVIHLTGRMSTALSERACAAEGVTARAFSFFERMDLAYGAADFAVGRAGATFLAEASARRLPAVLVPYPFAGGHQMLNARAFARTGRSVIIEQKDFTPQALAGALEDFIARAAEARRQGAPPKAPTNSRTKLMNFIEECAGWRT